MTELSKEGNGIMDDHSVFNIPESLRNLLANIHQSYDSRRDVTGGIEQNHGAVDQNSDQEGQEAVSRLLHTLAASPAASVPMHDIFSVLTKCQSKPFEYDPYRELIQCVVQKASDAKIKASVTGLIRKFLPKTPPKSTVSSNFPIEDTPRTASSASQQGFEQTEALLKDRIFEEIKHCTWRNVGGFDGKYFEGKEWTPKSKDIYDQVSSQFVNGRWTDFPDPPLESQVFDWLDKFQKDFLSDARGQYVRVEVPGELTGGEAPRQLDIFLIRKTRFMENSKLHDWKDIQVIGEHKSNPNFAFKPLHLQMSRYVREAFIAQPTRRFVHGFTLRGASMELWVFDRSGCFSSGSFDIHEQPQRFIGAIVGYAMMTDEELGLDTFIQWGTEGRFVDIKEFATEQKKRLELEMNPFSKRRAIVSRGTSCYRTSDLKNVVKFSWTSTGRPLEEFYLRKAQEQRVKGIATLIGQSSITSIGEMREGLTITAAQRHQFKHYRGTSSTPRSSFQHSGSRPHSGRVPSGKRNLINDEPKERKKSRSTTHAKPTHEPAKEQAAETPYTPNEDPYDDRQFTCLAISPAGRALVEYEDVPELLTALRDAIKAHKSLYIDGGILHRDISESNIIITDPSKADGFAGMLIDLDLARESEQLPSGVRQHTGTMEFMAIEVLRGNVRYTYRHDLESFFYVLLWLCARRAWEVHGQQPKSEILKRWYSGTFPDIASAKASDMTVIDEGAGFGRILKEFHPDFESVKNLCENIRSLLFTYDESKGGLVKNTPQQPVELYDPIIKAFDKAITDAQHRKKVNSDQA